MWLCNLGNFIDIFSNRQTKFKQTMGPDIVFTDRFSL